MASRAKKPPGDAATPTPTRPSRPRVTRPQVVEVLKSKGRKSKTSKTKKKFREISELVETGGAPDRSADGRSKARGKRDSLLRASNEKSDRDASKARGKRSLLASTEKPEDPKHDTKDTKKKSRGKRPLPAESTEEPDLDTKDTMKSRKRKKLDRLGDLSSQTQPLSPKGSEANKSDTNFLNEFSKDIPIEAEKDIPIEAASTDNIALADEEVPKKAIEKVASPHAEEEVPTDNEPSPSEPPVADHMKEVPEKPTDIEPSPSEADQMKEVPTEKEPSPPEPVPVADHMKDDILINVEEPISRLKKKKDNSKGPTAGKTKELQAESATPNKKEPLSVSSVVNIEEPPKVAEPKQDSNTEKGKPPSVANLEETAAENLSTLTGLVMHYSKPDNVPSHSDLVKLFSQYGPVIEARTQTGNTVNSASVIFKRHYDAEGAFHGAGMMTRILGPGLASFHLSDFPSGGAGAPSQ